MVIFVKTIQEGISFAFQSTSHLTISGYRIVLSTGNEVKLKINVQL